MNFAPFAYRWYIEPALVALAEDAPDLSELLNRAGEFLRSALSWLLQSNAIHTVLGWIMLPATTLLGINHPPHSGYGLLFLLLLGWFMWARSLRVSYCIVARAFGFYHPRQFIKLTRLWLPWRKPYQGLMFIRRWWRQFLYGKGASRDWTGFPETGTYVFDQEKDCIPVGRLSFRRIPLFQPCAIPGGGRHVAYIAASGAGKTTQIQTAHIGCLHPSQAACIVDCDGTMVAAHGAALQAEGHLVIKVDADHIDKTFPCGMYDPMYELTRADKRHGRASVVSFAAILATALITQDSETQPVFADTARVFIKGLILYVFLCEERKNLMRVRELLTVGLPEKIRPDDKDPDPFQALLNEMLLLGTRLDDECNGEICKAIAAAAGVMNMGRHDKGNNFKSTAIYQTAWLDDPACRAMMESSDISGEDLKLAKNAPVVFLVATLTDIQTRLAPFFRAFTMLTLYQFQRCEPEKKLKHPCLFILDEFPSLGRMETVALAAPGFRKYGVRLVTVTQSLQRMQKSYPLEWRDFYGNAQCLIVMGLDDPDTLKFISEEMLGKCLRKEKVDGYHWFPRMLARCIGIKSLPAARYQMVERWLMDAQQCREFLDPSAGNIIVIRFGRAPMRLMRFSYWKELPVWSVAVNGYGENPLRSLTRSFLGLAEPALREFELAATRKAQALVVKAEQSFTEEHVSQIAFLIVGFFVGLFSYGVSTEPGWIAATLSGIGFTAAGGFVMMGLFSPLYQAGHKLRGKVRRKNEPPYRLASLGVAACVVALSFVAFALSGWLHGMLPKEIPGINDPGFLSAWAIAIPGFLLSLASGLWLFAAVLIASGPVLYGFYLGLLLVVWNPLLAVARVAANLCAYALARIALPVGRFSPALARWLTARAAALVRLSAALRSMRLSAHPMT